MQRRSNIGISFLIVILSILTILCQFGVYYFIASDYAILGISSLALIICCHILLEQSATYEACFIYTVLNVFISVIITALTYLGNDSSFTLLPYTGILLGIIAVNWLIPTLHCIIRYMLDYGTRIEGFFSFYRSNNIIFVLFYIGIIVYGLFFSNSLPWTYEANSETVNFTPFLMISAQIEDYIYSAIPLSKIIIYLCSRILLFVPFGFYIAMIARRQSRLLKFAFLLLFPLVLEIAQYFVYPALCDIDDVIYGLLGGLLGSFGFFLLNLIFKAFSGKDFLAKDPAYRFSNSSLHF